MPQLPKLKLGLGVQWQDKTYLEVPEAATEGVVTQQAGIIKQDAYALVNLMASYELNDHITLQANGNNLTNENTYLISRISKASMVHRKLQCGRKIQILIFA